MFFRKFLSTYCTYYVIIVYFHLVNITLIFLNFQKCGFLYVIIHKYKILIYLYLCELHKHT